MVTKMRGDIYALAGFLGQKHDFLFLQDLGIKFIDINYLSLGPFNLFTKRLGSILKDRSILIGYSQGARIAMGILTSYPEKFRAGILISPTLGFVHEEKRYERLVQDILWGKKFLTEPIIEVLKEWDNQSIFLHSKKPSRNLNFLSNKSISMQLRYLSSGNHENFIKKINQLDLPMLFIYPEKEEYKLDNIALKNPNSSMVKVNQSHRLMLDEPKLLKMKILNFVMKLDTV